MTQTSINYAIVLYELEISEKDISDSLKIIHSTDVLLTNLESPTIGVEIKCRIIDKIFLGTSDSDYKFPIELVNFYKILCRYGSIGYIDEIYEAYKSYSSEKKDILQATVKYVEMPNANHENAIKDMLKKKFNKSGVIITYNHCPDLIGGFIIEAGGVTIDRSIKGRINQLNRQLVKR